jgi:hypothetical protein
MRQIGPYSKPNRLAILDGRTLEAKLMARVRAELTQHLGSKVTAPQRILIDRCAALTLRLHLMDRETAQSGRMSEKNGREYLCWNNSLTRTLRTLGLDAAATPKPRWQPPAASPSAAPPAAAVARTERLAQRAAEIQAAKL